MFFCIGENSKAPYSIGEGETIENAIYNWSSLCGNWSSPRDNWGGIIAEFKRYDPTIIQGLELDLELECPPPIIKIL